MEQSFRPMRRFRQALSKEESVSLLKTEKRGTLAVIGDGGYPYAVPINFYYDEAENKLYFHCARVIVFGRVRPVEDAAVKYEKAKAFGMKYYPSEEELEQELARDLGRACIMEISIGHMSGKLVHEK